MRFPFPLRRSLVTLMALPALAAALAGCPPPPETVPYVDLSRYVGKWFEIASYEVFFNEGLTGVTAEYGILPDGKISVKNRGFAGSLDGPEDSIEGKARVVDKTTNAKLAVRFNQPFGALFEGSYWIVDLDAENYEWAVVSDPTRFTLFILSRTPQMDDATLDPILERLADQGFDLDKLNFTPQPAL